MLVLRDGYRLDPNNFGRSQGRHHVETSAHSLKITLIAAVAAIAGLSLPQAALADYLYTYTGQLNSLSYLYQGAQTGPLVGVKQITFQFDVASPLFIGQTDHLTNNVVSWSISDGVNTMTSALCATTSGCTGFYAGNDYLTVSASGQITSWLIDIAAGGANAMYMATSGPTPQYGTKNGPPVLYDFTNAGVNVVGATTGPGVWTVVPVNPVPLPAAAWLMLSGLGVLGVMARRKGAVALVGRGLESAGWLSVARSGPTSA
jgi:hypothetical protein